MTSPALMPAVEAGEKPLSRTAKAGLMVSAAMSIVLFYLFALVSILLLLVFLAAELIAFLALMRFGVSRYVAPFIQRHSTLLLLFVRSFWIRKRIEFQVPLEEQDAPALFTFLRQLSERLQVPAPRHVRIEMNAGAWVLLKGIRRGADATTLGLGYDLIAGLSEQEVEAVLAHEMVHAKLVRRGLKHWLRSGLNRAATLTNALSALIGQYRQSHVTFELGEWLLNVADRCTRLTARLVATYSRQDEFEADLGAAKVCGGAPLRSSLIKLDSIAAKTSRIGWNERVARLQRGEGFSAWLVEELTATDSVQDTAGLADSIDHYSTHPSLRDRLAALPHDPTPTQPSRPAMQLFANPDAVASRLITEIQRVARLEEERDTREQRRWLTRMRRGASIRPLQWLGLLVIVIGIIIACFAWADGFRAGILIFGLFTMAGGVWLYRAGYYRDRRSLPVPEFEALKAAWEKIAEVKTPQAREKELATELDSATAAKTKRKKKAYLIAESYAALEQCDYLRAHVTARQCVQLDRKCVEASLAFAVACAAFHQYSEARVRLGVVQKTTGFRSRSTQWGAGWALLLLRDWAGAEALLQEAKKADPDHPTLAALMAICQARRNKLHSGIAHARIAFAAAPRNNARIELLADLLLDGGYLREAEQLLAGAGVAVRSDPSLTLAMIRLHLLQRNFEAADQWIETLRAHGIGAHTSVQLGGACETARRDEQAAGFYGQALEQGFYPEAHLGLARLAIHRRDQSTAKQHILASLDINRALGDKARSPLSLFAQSLRQLLTLQEPIANARAWTATFTGNPITGPLAGHSFLVFATSEQQAEDFLKTVADAVQPDKPSLTAKYAAWKVSPRDLQPVGAVRPGIQHFWK